MFCIKSSKQLIVFMGVTGTKMSRSANALLELQSFTALFLIVCFYLSENMQLDLGVACLFFFFFKTQGPVLLGWEKASPE